MSNLNPVYTPNHVNWNYSNQNKEGYTEILVGTVVAIQRIQATEYQTGRPRFWPEGNPVFNIRIAVITPEDQLVTFTFQPASKAAREGKKKSVHIDLWHLTGDTDLINLIGKTIMITTKPGNYGANNPRPFEVALVTDAGPYELSTPLPEEFKLDEILIERPQQQQYQPQQQPQYAPPMQGQYYQAPQAQPMQPMQQQYIPQPQMQQYQQPMQQQPQQQQGLNPMQPQMPQGMDPNVAAAMQQMNATNVQPVVGGSVYDEGIPFQFSLPSVGWKEAE